MVQEQLQFMEVYKSIQLRSNAAFVPTSGERLVRSRFVEVPLVEHLEHFLGNAEDADFLREFFPTSLPVGFPLGVTRDNASGSWMPKERAGGEKLLAVARAEVDRQPHSKLVAKSLFRSYFRPVQSNVNAQAGGGKNDALIVRGRDEILSLLDSHPSKAQEYILYDYQCPDSHRAELIVGGELQRIGAAVYEVALFGSVLAGGEKGSELVVNSVSGVAARTRPLGNEMPQTQAFQTSWTTPYGAMTSVAVLDSANPEFKRHASSKM
jgi:hypothetical protein